MSTRPAQRGYPYPGYDTRRSQPISDALWIAMQHRAHHFGLDVKVVVAGQAHAVISWTGKPHSLILMLHLRL